MLTSFLFIFASQEVHNSMLWAWHAMLMSSSSGNWWIDKWEQLVVIHMNTCTFWTISLTQINLPPKVNICYNLIRIYGHFHTIYTIRENSGKISTLRLTYYNFTNAYKKVPQNLLSDWYLNYYKIHYTLNVITYWYSTVGTGLDTWGQTQRLSRSDLTNWR